MDYIGRLAMERREFITVDPVVVIRRRLRVEGLIALRVAPQKIRSEELMSSKAV